MKRVLLICLLAAASARAQVRVGPVTLVPAGPVQPSLTAEGVDAATSGQEFLLTYHDSRGGRAARISLSGEVLDPFGIVLPFQPDRVAWAGSHYFALAVTRWSTSYVRITPSGTMIDAEAQRIKTLDATAAPLVASDGKHVVLVYPANGAADVTLIGGDGTVAFARHPALAGWQPAAVASNGREFLLIATRELQLATFRLSARGTPLDREPRVIPEADAAGTVRVASNGDGYLIVSGNRAFAIDASGRRTSEPVDVRRSTDARDAVAWNGEEYVLASSTNQPPFGIWLTRIGRNGERVTEPSFREAASALHHVTVAAAGSDTLVATSALNRMPVMATVFPAGFPADAAAIPVTFASPRQLAVTAALGAEGWLVVWLEPDGVYATRLDLDGRLVDGARMRLGEEPANGIGVAWCGNAFLAAWSNSGGLSARAVSFRDGAAGEPMRIAVGSSTNSIAGSPEGAALVWGSDAVRAVFFDADGQRRGGDPIELRPTSAEFLFQVHATFDGSRFAALWLEGQFNPTTCRFGHCPTITNARVMARSIGANAGPPVQALGLSSPAAWGTVGIHGLAWRGSTGLLAWDQSSGGFHVFVDRDLRPTAVSTAASGTFFVAEDGENFLVVDASSTGNRLTAMSATGARSEPVELPLRRLASGRDRRALAIDIILGTEGADAGVPRAATALIVDDFAPR